MRPTILALLLFCAAPACAADAQQFTGRVMAVEDGDTVRVQRGQGDVRVRIFGIDAPEATQPYGPEAREQARRLLLDRTVVVSMKDIDQYGRLVAALSVDGRDAGTELISSGAAWNYAQFSQDDRFAALESGARDARRGLWALPDPTPPWLFRSAARGRGAGPVGSPGSATGALHGNVTSRVFHAPGCESYDCANCTVRFESQAAAVAAGYRPHRACVR
jgi:endonuclease YncB( thermonuclease family)